VQSAAAPARKVNAMGKAFDLIETRFRRIATPIPVPASVATLETMTITRDAVQGGLTALYEAMGEARR
jgi:hypothetical protein